MAKNSRDDLLKAFVKSSKRKRRVPGTFGYQPVKQGTTKRGLPAARKFSPNATFTRYAEDDNPDTRLIPGFGGVRRARERRRAQALKRPVPGGYQPGRRGQTKPTPGSYYGRKKPRLN